MARQREARVHLEAGVPLSLRRMEGREEVSRVSRYDITLLGPSHDVDLETLLGTGITVEIEGTEGSRYIHGHVADIVYRGPMEDRARYDVTLVPWLWFLTRRTDCRIFQRLSAIEIVKRVVAAHGGELSDRLTGHYLEREYCVQYRESDLDFVCRLLEEEGVFFFFEHSQGRHALVLADDAASCPTARGYASVPFYPPDDPLRRERDHLDRWDVVARARTARTALRSFDFKQPAKPLEAANRSAGCHARDDLEAFDYPGGFVSADAGDARARVRLEELRADRRRAIGAGTAVGLACGHRFALRNFPRSEQNTDHFILAVETLIEVEPQRTASTMPTPEPYRCTIEAMSTRFPFRPARSTPKPFVQGPQTAIVTGPSGEEIYTDEHGRVKVQFHWDREGRSDANSSCWLRVSQAWAGAGFGSVQIPRVGQEVIVDFLEGDPDQPIITGRVYNAHQRPPHGLPTDAVKSGIKSSSTKGGGGSNELTFDDTKGNEKAYFHAQYNHEAVVGNDETRQVGKDRTITVGGTHTETVTGNTSIAVSEGNYSHTVAAGNAAFVVGGTHTETVAGNTSITVSGGNYSHTVAAGNATYAVGGTYTETVGGSTSVTISAGNYSHTVAAGTATVAVRGKVTEVFNDAQETQVTQSITVVSQASCVHVSAATDIVLEVGGSRLALFADGRIELSGRAVAIVGADTVDISGTSIKSHAENEHSISGATVLSSGKVHNTVQGGMVMLNP